MNENRGLIDKISRLREANQLKKDEFKDIEQKKGIKIKDILDKQKAEEELRKKALTNHSRNQGWPSQQSENIDPNQTTQMGDYMANTHEVINEKRNYIEDLQRKIAEYKNRNNQLLQRHGKYDEEEMVEDIM